VFNGASIRSKFFLDLYVGALDSSENSIDLDALTLADETMIIRLYVVFY
jgi:hypothetical protein